MSLTALNITNKILQGLLPSDDTSTVSPKSTWQPEDWIRGRDLIEGFVYPVWTFRKQGKWKHMGKIVEEDKAWRHQAMGAVTKIIVTTSSEISVATDSSEGEYFKLCYNIPVFYWILSFKLFQFSSFHAQYYIKLTIRHKVQFMQYVQFCV